jgi:two-component system sensor histidine kinase/response regulator
VSKVLIIEDEKPILESIKEYLQVEGYECLTAPSGTTGIIIAKKELPDIILCDIKMPGINGHQVLKELRADPRTSFIPLIFVSALVDQEDLRAGMVLGADDYITKPFQPEDLLGSIETRLEKYAILRKRMEDLKDSISLSLPHELQTPLVSIMGYSELLTDKFKDGSDSEALEFSQAILEAGVRLNRLIKNFIFYEKLKQLSTDKKLVDQIKSFTKVTPDLIHRSANKVVERYERKIDLLIDAQQAEVTLPVDYFSILFEELLDNAFKFSERGTKVSVESGRNENFYQLSITDEGRGMSNEQISAVGAYLQFERDKYEQQGMGLGLIISMKIAELFGGELNINSEYGKGTKIVARFPSDK